MDADLLAELPPDRSGQEAPLTPLLARYLALLMEPEPDITHPDLAVINAIDLLLGDEDWHVDWEARRMAFLVPPASWPRVVAMYRRPNRQRAQPKEIVLTLPEGLVTLRQMEEGQ